MTPESPTQPPSLTDDELFDALNGLYAYDTGSIDSGIHDEALRARVKRELELDARPSQIAGDRLARFVRDRMLNEESITAGYGLEDVAGFIRWLGEYMDIEL